MRSMLALQPVWEVTTAHGEEPRRRETTTDSTFAPSTSFTQDRRPSISLESPLSSASSPSPRSSPSLVTSMNFFSSKSATKDAAEASPFAEGLLKKGFEVLFLTEPIDEVAVSNLADFEEKKFIDVTKEGLDLGDGEEADDKGDSKEMEGLLSWVKDVLGAKVES